MTARSFVARVPASSANLGSGFDVLGLALTLYAEVGPVDPDGVLPARARVAEPGHPAAVAFRRGGGVGAVWVHSPIPGGRGLGFSGAVRVGGLLAAHAQRHGGDRDVLVAARGALLSLATDLEGHPDNAAASLLGGFVVAAGGHALRVPVAMEVAVVAWVPSHSTSTDVSRHRLGENVSRADAVFNIGRSALLVAALATGDVDVLRAATQDRLHQPVRLAAAPRSAEAMEAALAAGAWCAWLSGSGPTVVALCAPDDAAQLSEALPMGAQVKVLHIDLDGAVLNAG